MPLYAHRCRDITQHDGETFLPFFFRSLHDCYKVLTSFARLSQMARGYLQEDSGIFAGKSQVVDVRSAYA